MGKVRVWGFGVSLDGFSAGPGQDLEHPLGVGGEKVFEWFFATRTFRTMHGGEDGETGVDDDFARRGFDNVGAWILGRNMFGPVRGPWPDDSWKGWWGDDPPYHVPTFVLTSHARKPLVMKGGTTFYFVTDGIDAALAQAREAAGDKDVRVGGGVETVRAYLRVKLVDEMHLAVAPVLLGEGEALFAGIDLPALGYAVVERVATPRATHVVIAKQPR
jgi:dihydrofolate reductase